VHLVFDIFQGIGVAAAIGVRPFLPALVTGILGAADAEIQFTHTSYSFLQSTVFLLAMAVCVALGLALAARLRADRARPTEIVLAVISLVLGALFFAGSLARGHYAAWPGLIGGVVCAAVGIAATVPLFARVRARLDPEAAGALPLVAEGGAGVSAGLSVIAPPVGVVVLGFLVWLLIAGRRRSDQKYAGLRILR
jgi:4-amino-4-deoxy-L-arabinose transferase-like glycosyltransferase